ncbi:MAG: PQQ-binding-like beta-propeller repeat protein, partial [candidate division WOR-3 bacterium]
MANPMAEEWPTYRHDEARSGATNTSVSSDLKLTWQTPIGGRLSSPVVAGGRVFVASVDEHTIHALDAASGKPIWTFTAGGRVDSPPTVWRGRVIFGCLDGHVYCLRASDGALAWRLCAAGDPRRIVVRGQIESPRPVHGSVLLSG